jgi:hypothetical protein
MNQTQRTLQDFKSTASPAEVLDRAKKFFTRYISIYATFLEKESPNHVAFRGQGGEELIIAVHQEHGYTLVSGSTYMFDQQVARFFTTLPAFELTELLLPHNPSAEAAVTNE